MTINGLCDRVLGGIIETVGGIIINKITIENLKHEELEQYKSLIDDCFGGSQEIEYYREAYSLDKNYDIIVAKMDDKIVGSITMMKIDLFTFGFQPMIELFNVCVNSEYRRYKIGTLMIDYVIKFARDNNYKSIVLTCKDDLPDIHNFYEKVGFAKTNSRKYTMNI